MCSGLQSGRGTKLSPLSLLAAKTGQNSPCMRKTTQNARNLASRANFVTQAPPTGHAGRILSRNTLHSGNAGRVPSRLQLRGRTLAPECARKPLDMHAGGAARTHVVGPRCRSSGLHAPGAHTQGLTQYSQERGKHNQLKHRLSRATKPKSHHKTNTFCPSFRLAPTTFNTDFPALTSRKVGLKDKKSWWRVSPSCFGGGLCGGGRARRWRRPIWG